jgi:hypothetical protein
MITERSVHERHRVNDASHHARAGPQQGDDGGAGGRQRGEGDNGGDTGDRLAERGDGARDYEEECGIRVTRIICA